MLITFSTSHTGTETGQSSTFTTYIQNGVSWPSGHPWKHREASKCKMRAMHLMPVYLRVSSSEQHSPGKAVLTMGWGLEDP